MDIEVVAILNDTTGTLMAGAFLDEKCKLGVILGKLNGIPTMKWLLFTILNMFKQFIIFL